MPGSGAVWKNNERYKARCPCGGLCWGQADALHCNCLNTTSQHRDKQSESTQTHRWCTNIQTHRQGAHIHKLYTSPLKRHLPAQSRSIHTQITTQAAQYKDTERHRHTAEQDPQRRAFRKHTCPGSRVDDLFTTRRKRSSRKPPEGVL